MHITLNCVHCAHDYKETKTSLLSSQESFGVIINVASGEKGGSQSIHVSELEGSSKES